jgi:hypothetical protein
VILIRVIAVLSTTILPLDGVYEVDTVTPQEGFELLKGAVHYIGHPSTKAIIEELGAIPADSNLFSGLMPGESALAVSIKQGQSTRRELGHTVHQDVCLDDLSFRVIRRADICSFCKSASRIYWACGSCGAT